MASTPQEAVNIAARAGLKYIELTVTTWKMNPETVTKEDIASLKSMFKSAGVEASSLGMIWPRDYRMVTGSPDEWRRNINYADRLFQFSAALGVENLNLGGTARGIPLSIPYSEGLKTLVKFWKEASRYAENYGVKICIECLTRSHESNVGNTAKEIIDLVEAVDSHSFKINAQIHQMAYTDYDVPAAIRASGDRIRLVHIADVGGFNRIMDTPLFMMPGRGKLDFVSIFRAFKDVSYDGEFCMEPQPETLLGRDVISELRMGKEYLEAKWRDA